ncbi:MAG: permease-like cell division protein FtsX [Nevskiales bacterium]
MNTRTRPPPQPPPKKAAPAPAKKVRRADDLRPNALRRFVQEHARICLFSLGQLYRAPAASVLTAAVIGITLALPAGLHLLLTNFNRVSLSWERTVQASLFLKDNVSEARGAALAQQIGRRAEVSESRYLSRADALAEFRRHSGFGAALDLLGENPLPAVITVQPKAQLPPRAVEGLITQLRALPEIEVAQLDQAWLQRLHAILRIVELVVQALALLLGLAVIVIVGNTIRLDIQNRKDEIVVMKLLGATNSFIRRPFLYTGFWYGLSGGLLAWLLLQAVLWSLTDPVARLAGLYQSDFRLGGLGLEATLTLFLGSVFLGLLGSWWTVGRHLQAIEPQ